MAVRFNQWEMDCRAREGGCLGVSIVENKAVEGQSQNRRERERE